MSHSVVKKQTGIQFTGMLILVSTIASIVGWLLEIHIPGWIVGVGYGLYRVYRERNIKTEDSTKNKVSQS